MEYLENARPARAFTVREGDNTPIETNGNPYGYSRFHIRGPDGPRGGRRTLCGTRVRGSQWFGGCTAQIVVNTLSRRAPRSFAPSTPSHTYTWYPQYVCTSCAEKWAENAVRAA